MFEFDAGQISKISELVNSGASPYPPGSNIENNLNKELSQLREMSITKLEGLPEVTFAARLRFKNEMGSMGFGRVDIQGESLQISVKKNEVSKGAFQAWKRLDLGDWILVSGKFTRTRVGELTVNANTLSLYSKCMMGMPDKVSGITDPETRHRMRYLDLIVNKESRQTFEKRFAIIKFIRRYLEDSGFVEVETPILQPIPGGASARPFSTHHNALDTDLFLRIAPELYLKRLVVGGFEKVFEIGKNFRNEGISQRHNPEFTMVEFYQAHATYESLMSLTKKLLTSLIESICSSHVIKFNDKNVDFSNWAEKTFIGSIAELGVGDPWNIEHVSQFLSSKGVYLPEGSRLEDLHQKAFDIFVEPNLINPTFITQYPASISPLARRSDKDPRVTDRFELFVCGFEIANGFSELNDPVDQASRFQEQMLRKSNGDEEAMYFDQDYIRALAYGMPPTAGEGIGIDRLVMLLTNSESIRDVILFPTKKLKDV